MSTRQKFMSVSISCLLVLGIAGIALAQDGSGTWNWGQWNNESPPIKAFIKNYYGYMLYNVRILHEPSAEYPGLLWGREWFADDCQMIVRTQFAYDETCKTCEHAAGTPWDCSCPGVYCGAGTPDGVAAVLKKFAGQFPGMKHDNMDMMYQPIGNNVWWVWTRYDYKAILHDLNTGVPIAPEVCINFPGFTILTVDMKQRRSDGGKGRITKIDIGWDNLIFEEQLGIVP